MKVLYILLLLIVPCLACEAQPYYFKHYQVENGLSNNTVYCSLQDSHGFLWLGTKDGLNRFDGYSFKTFRHDGKDPKSLANNFVHVLSLDAKGNVWVGTDKGVDCYNVADESFMHMPLGRTEAVRSIAHDLKGNTWIIAAEALVKFDADGKVFKLNKHQYLDATSLMCRNGAIWLSTAGGLLFLLDSQGNIVRSYDLFKNSKHVASNSIQKIFDAGDNQILVGTTDQGIKLFDIPTGTYKDILTYNEDHTSIFVRDFLHYDAQQFWIATESGIYIYNRQSGAVIHLKKNYHDSYSLSDNAVYTLLKDNEGGVWAGTYFGGVNYYSKQYSIFNKYYPGVNQNSLKGNVVREICRDKYGNLWLGTEDNGLNKLSPDKHTWTHFAPSGKSEISNSNIHGLYPFQDKLFIGTFERGLNVLDIPSGKVEKVYLAGKAKNELKSNFVISFCRTQDGALLIGTTKGLYRYNGQLKDFTLIKQLPPDACIYAMCLGHDGKIWLGTVNDGLYSFEPVGNRGGKIRFKDDAQVLATSMINGVYEDSNRQLWLGTDGQGLWSYDPVTQKSKSYTINNGFPSNQVYRILEDDSKNLWISTSHGLVCLSLTTGNQHIYTKANGLLSDQFNYNSAYKDVDGTLYFGCLKGMISFNPAAFKQTNRSYPVYITGFQVHNQEATVGGKQSLLKQSLLLTKEITLNHQQASFSIDFAALNFSAPEMIRYRYMMKGVDKGWIELNKNRKVYFTQLAPGNYTFMVKAANSKGQWTDDVTSLKIYITPPFWASIYAYLIYIVAFIAAVYYLLRRYHLKTRQKNERIIELLNNDKEKQIYTAKIEFFTNIAHEIRTPLTLIKGPMENLMKNMPVGTSVQHSLKMMETNTDRLLNLTNQLLDFRKTEQEGYRLNFVKTNISTLLANTFLLFTDLAERKSITFFIDKPTEDVYAYIDSDAFSKIIYNLIGNAIKYSIHIVKVTLFAPQQDDDQFVIEFCNDGYIIPFDMREKIFEPFYRLKMTEKLTGTGIGLPLSRSLAELHKGRLELKKHDMEMNIFVLSIPIHQDYEFDFTISTSAPSQLKIPHNNDLTQSVRPVILIVDDNPEILDFITQQLRGNYTVMQALNGQEAMHKIKTEAVNLIVSDIMMPVMDGFELCKNLKTDLTYSHIPIILLTAKNTLQSKIQGLDIGADAYIEKPFSTTHLEVQISNLLNNRNKIKEHFANSPLTNIRSMAHSKADEKFLETLHTIICDHMQEVEMDADYIANLMNMSKPTLYRKIKAISDLSLNELINITRLKAAAQLLESGEHKVYEVASLVGYSSQSQLGRNFLKQFGHTPTEYQQQKGVKKSETASNSESNHRKTVQ